MSKPKLPNLPNLTSYASLLGESFASKVQLLESIIQDKHYPSVGKYKERLLAEAIRQHVPQGIGVGTGFVLFIKEHEEGTQPPQGFDPSNQGQHVLSKECDIIVYDATSAPVIFKDGDFVIVRPEVVKSVIEVKGKLLSNNVSTALENFLDFGHKWRRTQLFYKERDQRSSSRPSLYLLAWAADAKQMDGTKLREKIANFYRDNLNISEYSGFPILKSGFIYNEVDVSSALDADKSLYGWQTFSGKFVRFDSQGEPIHKGDRTIASLISSIHYDLGSDFNRFYSHAGETNLDLNLPLEHYGFATWLEDNEEIKAILKDEPS